MPVFGKSSLKNLEGVHPDLVKVLKAAITDCPVDFSIIEGLRSLATQQKYYTYGRSVVNPNTGPLPGNKFGSIITNADGVGNKSNHQKKADGYGHAVDLYPYVSGKVDYSDKGDNLKVIAAHVIATGKCMGIQISWGGAWKGNLIDKPHFELKS